MNSKAKGARFEREVCVDLSMWVTNGKRKDVFWRSSMSGGRATIIRNKGESNRQAGDICAVAPEGHFLTDKWFFEVKHLKNLELTSFVLGNCGLLARHWVKAKAQALRHRRQPIVIAKQNNMPTIMLTQSGFRPGDVPIVPLIQNRNWDIYLFSDWMATKCPKRLALTADQLRTD